MTTMPMFPLGSVLFPYMPLQLRVFEERYLVMLSRILTEEPAEFGVVLIERGQEVGGGEQRFQFGTVAQVTELQGAEGFVGLLAQGDRRIQVTEWLDEDPHPRASVRELPDLEWDDALWPVRRLAEQLVRRVLAQASEFSDQQWSSTVELAEDPVAAAWQLAAIAPLGQIDQIKLLQSVTTGGLLALLIDLVHTAEETMQSQWEADAADSELADGDDIIDDDRDERDRDGDGGRDARDRDDRDRDGDGGRDARDRDDRDRDEGDRDDRDRDDDDRDDD